MLIKTNNAFKQVFEGEGKTSHINSGIYVSKTQNKGLGVFAGNFIEKGQIIEICPAIVLSNDDCKLIRKSLLYRYVYQWYDPAKISEKDLPSLTMQPDDVMERYGIEWAIVAGYGMIYNHNAALANAEATIDYPNTAYIFHALKDIQAGEEICVDYGVPLWFEEH